MARRGVALRARCGACGAVFIAGYQGVELASDLVAAARLDRFVVFSRRGYVCFFSFFFQAEDGIRDGTVTGVQTCALPIYSGQGPATAWPRAARVRRLPPRDAPPLQPGPRQLSRLRFHLGEPVGLVLRNQDRKSVV